AMESGRTGLLALALMVLASPAWCQAPAKAPQANWWSAPAREDGPTRLVWAGRRTPDTPYTGPNRPIWRIADLLKAHGNRKSWDQQVMLNRDFDGHYVSMAPGEKSKCLFYADDRAFGWIYSGQLKVSIDGQEPKVLSKGWFFNVAPRLSYCLESVGNQPVVFFRVTPAGQAPSYPESETPAPLKGYTYEKVKITSTGGYDSFNMPFFNMDEYGASTRTGERFLYDGHTSSNLNIGPPLTQLPPDTSWGHFHENMQEVWLNVWGNVCALISGVGVVHGEYG